MRRSKRGFTLIELAMVLIALGILAGIGAGIVGLLIKRIHYNQNRERLEANVESIVGYALSHHGRLPSSDNCSQYLRNTKDVWGKGFICVTADELVNDGACARRTTSLQVTDDNDSATHDNIAFVIISGGPNYNVQTRIQTSNQTGTTSIHIYAPETPNVDDYPDDMNRPESYDDMVRYVSLDELKAKLKCSYSEEALRILNNELPYGFEGSSYNATVYAAGGVPFSGGNYEWCVEDPDGLTNTGITIDCDGNDPVNDNCSDSAATWQQCGQLNLSGSSNSTGTYKLSFFVRDADNNTAQKSLSVTINPATSGGGGGGGGTCETYTLQVQNNMRNNYVSYEINSVNCTTVYPKTFSAKAGLSATDKLDFWEIYGCGWWEEPSISGPLQYLDTNNDCTVSIECKGNYNCSYN